MKMAIATNQLFGEYQMARKLFGLKHIAGQRYREDPGLYYEDFQPVTSMSIGPDEQSPIRIISGLPT